MSAQAWVVVIVRPSGFRAVGPYRSEAAAREHAADLGRGLDAPARVVPLIPVRERGELLPLTATLGTARERGR